MLKLMMTVLGSLCLWHASAQLSVTGVVTDASSHELLVGATLQLESGESAVTDAQGKYELKNVNAGTHTLTVRFVGYEEGKFSVEVKGNFTFDIALKESALITDEVLVLATRAQEKGPTTFSNISKEVIQKQNFGQDLPFVLNWTPSLVTTSDAGAGVGYTGVRIRGSDGTRINVTINGIPLNDAEEQGVFWVDVPDIATSTNNIQIQRGVGTSTNGAGAFGASISLQTNQRTDQPYADIINSFGSFGTHRHTVGFGTGLKNNFAFDGRLSLIGSDGYINRATSDLKSYYLAGGYYGKKTIVKGIVFGGKEITYQSWYGVPQSRLNNDTNAMLETAAAEGWNQDQINNLLNSGRTFNVYTYPNQVDNYSQDHYQLHFSHRANSFLTASASLHYTYGRGYYEEYKGGAPVANYGITPSIIGKDTVRNTDLVRRRWLDNRFYGITWSLNYEKDRLNMVLGGAANRYDGDHYGEIVWAQVATTIPPFYRYYFNNGDKRDFNVFWKGNYQITSRLNGFVDLQYRHIGYEAHGIENELQNFTFNLNYDFFNPKAGLTYLLNNGQNVYASYSVGNREPVRSDFVDASSGGTWPKNETLHDWEVGWRLKKSNSALNVNFYYMAYNNQLVPTGKLNDVGAALRTNVADSYRAGIEIDGGIRFNKFFTWNANLTLSRNKIKSFTEVLYDYGANYDQYNEVDKIHSDTDIAFSPNLIGGSNFLFHPIAGAEIGLLTKYVGKQYLDNTSNESRIIDSYFINDLRFSYAFKPAFMKELSMSLLLNNLFDQKYSSNGYTYGYFGGGSEVRQNYYYPQAGRNFLLMVAMKF
jgi:iron complex outermembrane receptor protein